MDDLNNHNPLLDDDDNSNGNAGAVDSSNPLLDEEYDEDEDLSLLGIDVYNLDTGSNPWQRELVDGSPMDELDALPSLYDEDKPSPYDAEVARFNAKNGHDGHGEWVESSHLIPESYNDVNGDDFEDDIDADRDSGVHATGVISIVKDDVVESSRDDDTFVSDSVAGDFDDEFGDLLGGDDVEVDDETVTDSLDDILNTALKGIDDTVAKSSDSFNSSYDMDEDDDEDDDQDRYAGFHIDKIISLGIDLDASDVHINADDMIAFTVLGDIRRITDFGVIPAAVVQRIFADITSHVSQDNFARDLELDASYVLREGRHKGRRTRLNVGRSFGNVSMVFRIIANEIPTPASLGITDSLLDWCSLPNGLIMVNGPTGTGKAIRLDTKIPTPSGWTTMGDLQVGDIVYDSKMKPTTVEWVSEVNESPDLYRVTFADGQVVYADADHHWIVSDRVSRKPVSDFEKRIIEARKLLALKDISTLDKLSEDFDNSELLGADELFNLIGSYGLDSEFSDENEIANILSESNCVISDGVRLYDANTSLLVLSGFLRNKFIDVDSVIVRDLTTMDMLSSVGGFSAGDYAVPLVEAFDGFSNVSDDSEFYNFGYSLPLNKIGGAHVFGEDSVIEPIHLGSLFVPKRIPVERLSASFADRLNLLRGLMSCDGSISSDGLTFELCFDELDLASDVLSLVRSLGVFAVCENFDESYRVSFVTDLNVVNDCSYSDAVVDDDFGWNPIVSIDSVFPGDADYGSAKCIGVDSDDHSYLCADYLVTHNSTTLASLVRQIQLTRPDKIVTIEKPIEFVYGTDGMSFITQREVGGRDTRTFAGALTSAMRQAPDIIMLGEVRNQVEVNELLRAAETGHLAISTMHTKSAPATIYRIKSLYDGDDQVRILGSLSEVARGFANQILLKTPDGSGRFAVREILNIDEDVSRLILHGDVEGIKDYQMENKSTMEHELARAVAEGNATKVSARAQAPILARFDKIMKELEK